MSYDRPRKAWLFAADDTRNPTGIDKDVADLRRLFEDDLHPDYRAVVRVVRSDPGTLTTDLIMPAFAEIAAFQGDRFVWFGAHGERRGFGTAFLKTDDRDGGHITFEALWRRLGEIARDGQGQLVAIIDACHAAVPAASPLINQLETSLVGIAATQIDQTARGTPTEGGWLTQRFIQALTAPESPPADGVVRVSSLIDSLVRDRVRENMGGQTPFLVGNKAHAAARLNRLAVSSRTPARPHDPIAVWRQYTQRQHTRLNMLFQANDERERVYVELALARDVRIDGGRPDEADAMEGLAERSGARLTLKRLMQHRPDGKAPRWRVLGEPGAGKSTVARRLAAELASTPGEATVVYLPLVEVVEAGRHPFEVAEAELARIDGQEAAAGLAGALHDAAAEGRVWLLLDGLDEVDPKKAKALRRDIAGWARALPETAIAVLSRPFDDHQHPGFDNARVQPLDRVQQGELLERWLGDTRATLLRDRIADRPRLRELARNPLMLSLMALLVDAGEDPGDSRTALYDRAIEVLLEQPQRYGRTAELTDPAAARAVLGALSVALHQKGGEAWPAKVIRAEVKAAARAGEIDPEDLDTCGGATGLMAELPRCGGVLGPFGGADDQWRYLHRSLREFLAAEHLAERSSRLQTVLNEVQKTKTPDRWGVVLGMACALAPKPAETLELVRAASDALALWALPEAELEPVAGLAFFDRVVGDSDPAKYGEDLRRLAVSWGPKVEAGATLLAGVGPDTPVERLAVVHYALSAAGVAVDDAAFFEQAGRPMPAPEVMVSIAGGSFVMGSPEDEEGRFEGEVQHPVTVSAFELGATAVTRAEYAAFDPDHQCPGGEQHPVTGVSWYAARLYAAWRGCSLPTEAEWEFACRAGTTTRFWSGDGNADLARVGWFDVNAPNYDPEPVARKPASPWGLYDMHGNVREWCADWYGAYEPADTTDPTGPPDGVFRVVRGGNAWRGARFCRSAHRDGARPADRHDRLGFRLARRPPSR